MLEYSPILQNSTFNFYILSIIALWAPMFYNYNYKFQKIENCYLSRKVAEKKKRESICLVRVPYRAEEPDELDLYLGETVTVLQTTADGVLLLLLI